MGWFSRFKSNPLPATPDTIEKTALELTWLDRQKQMGEYRKVARLWSSELPDEQLEELSHLGESIWEGNQMVFARPHVAVLHQNESVVGLVSGHLDERGKGFFIEYLVVHPKYTSEDAGTIKQLLVEAAIDASIAAGKHGWVSCSPETDISVVQWRGLGFSTQHQFSDGGVYMAKMGYFG